MAVTQLEQILYQLHHSKPEAYDTAEFYQVTLVEKPQWTIYSLISITTN